MEEQNKAKTVNMSSKAKERKPLTYEQLNDACNQLWQQNKQLVSRNQELEQFAINKRLDFLFKVLQYSNNFSSDFIVSCASEIEEALTIPQSQEEKED